jgi:ATP-binding cassette subfamily A (ABC1) protein 3
MVNGALACLGSLEHLRQRYGRGFQVELNTNPNRLADVRSFVQSMFQGADEQEHAAGRIRYLIPKQEGAHAITLAEIFSRIEQKKEELQISDYGVSDASLEQIFVSIARGQDQKLAEERANHNDAREARLRGDK